MTALQVIHNGFKTELKYQPLGDSKTFLFINE